MRRIVSLFNGGENSLWYAAEIFETTLVGIDRVEQGSRARIPRTSLPERREAENHAEWASLHPRPQSNAMTKVALPPTVTVLRETVIREGI
jgi:hypothetical protein